MVQMMVPMVLVDGVRGVGGDLLIHLRRVHVDRLMVPVMPVVSMVTQEVVMVMATQSDGREARLGDGGGGEEAAVHRGDGDQLGDQADGDVEGGAGGRERQDQDEQTQQQDAWMHGE